MMTHRRRRQVREHVRQRRTDESIRCWETLAPKQVRVRFPPSPTGNLHVGNVRSALFNWVFARHYGGTFVLRVEDTDAGRNLAESYQVLYDSLTWLGSDLGRGSGRRRAVRAVPADRARRDLREIVTQLLDAGLAYRCYCTREEIEAREAARPKGAPSGYDGFCRDLERRSGSPSSRPGVRAVGGADAGAGRRRSPSTTWSAGRSRFAAEHVPDYVIVRSNGEPLYTLVNPVDDSLMEITHVLRGEDLLPSTPRQIVVYEALKQIGVGSGRTPMFGHLPTVLGEGNRRLSKRDKGSGLAEYQEQGYLPEALLNYLALLGWAIAEDRDIFSLDEMVAAFDIRRVNANPARFDARRSARRSTPRTSGCCRPTELTDAPRAVPGPGRAGQRPAAARRAHAAGCGHAADPGADEHPGRGGRAAGLPVPRRRRDRPSTRRPV